MVSYMPVICNKTTNKNLELAPATIPKGFNWTVVQIAECSFALTWFWWTSYYEERALKRHLIIFESFSRKFPASVTAGPVLGYAGGINSNAFGALRCSPRSRFKATNTCIIKQQSAPDTCSYATYPSSSFKGSNQPNQMEQPKTFWFPTANNLWSMLQFTIHTLSLKLYSFISSRSSCYVAAHKSRCFFETLTN